MIKPEDIPEELVAAFGKAWEAKLKEIGRGVAEPGTKTRAGLAEVFNELGFDKLISGLKDPWFDGYLISSDLNVALDTITEKFGLDL